MLSHKDFKARFLGFHPKLYRVAYALLGDEDDAADAVQELYLKLWAKRDDLPMVLNDEAYAVALLKNMCLDVLRSVRVRDRVEWAVVDDVGDERKSEMSIERDEQIACVKRLIKALPPNQQQILRLRAIDDCSMNEIEKLTGMTNANVRQLLSRARKTINQQFKQLFSDERR